MAKIYRMQDYRKGISDNPSGPSGPDDRTGPVYERIEESRGSGAEEMDCPYIDEEPSFAHWLAVTRALLKSKAKGLFERYKERL